MDAATIKLRKHIQDSRLERVTKNLVEIFDSMPSPEATTQGTIDSLLWQMEAISSEMELDRVFDALARTLHDPSFGSVQRWKQQHPKGKAIAFFPVYVPVEIIHAAGMLPVGLAKPLQRSDPQYADSPGGSPVCSMVKTTLEMALKGHLEVFDAFLFSSICDPAQNLCSVFKRTFPEAYVDSIHLPQDCDSPEGVDSLSKEYRRILAELERPAGTQISDAQLRKSVDLYNVERALLRSLYAIRDEMPYLVQAWESYLVTSVGNLLPVEEYIPILRSVLSQLERRAEKPRDSVRVVVEGSFCEQPSLEVIRLLEAAGCSIVEDDFAVAQRSFQRDVSTSGDPVHALAESYVQNAVQATRRGSPGPRWEELAKKVRRTHADAVVMLVTTSCPAAFRDYMLFKSNLEKMRMPLLSLVRTESGHISLVKESEFLDLVKASKNHNNLCIITTKSPELNSAA
jgi:benzoyl-CoA reductase subunit C